MCLPDLGPCVLVCVRDLGRMRAGGGGSMLGVKLHDGGWWKIEDPAFPQSQGYLHGAC